MNHSFVKNSVYNFAGGAIPAIATLITLPMILGGLGETGYGLYVLVSAIVGYFAVIDINITAGSTKYLSEYHAAGNAVLRDQTLSFGLVVYLMIGIAGGLGLYFSASYLAIYSFKVSPEWVPVAKRAIELSAIGFGLSQVLVYMQSVPQAMLRFDISSRLEVGFGALTPVGSVGVLLLGGGLCEIITFRIGMSLLHCLLLWRSIRLLLPSFRFQRPGRPLALKIGSFSGFAFLSRIAAVTYVHVDKLLIGAMVGVDELAVYAIAATVGQRVLGLTFRASAVVFPVASVLGSAGHEERLRALYLKLSRYLVFVNGAALTLIAIYAEPILMYWIGHEFAARGALILQVLAFGQFIDSLTNLPSLVNDGMGHPRVSGLFAVCRALVGLVLIYFLVLTFGVDGAAWGHLTGAVILTTAFVVYVHGRTVPCQLFLLLSKSYLPPMAILLICGLAVYVAKCVLGNEWEGLLASTSIATMMICGSGIVWVLHVEDRRSLLAFFRKHDRRTDNRC